MNHQKLSLLLDNKVLIGDGAMGTMLYNKGIFINTCFDELNLTRPTLIKDIHQQYVAAGSDFIETNSFGANAVKLARFGLADKLEAINAAAVSLAREAAGQTCLVAAAVGPLGMTGQGDIDDAKTLELFGRQIAALAAASPDFLLLETFGSVSEILLALTAAENTCDLEVVAQLTVDEDYQTALGDRLEDAIVALCKRPNVAAVGLNCTLGPAAMLDCLDRVKKIATKPVALQPNAGLPQMVDGRTMYMSSPEYMAEYAKRYFEKGAKIIGACCGSTPEHIRQIARAIKPIQKAVAPRPVAAAVSMNVEQARPLEPLSLANRSAMGAKLASGQKVITIEISPPRGADLTGLLEKGKRCKAAGIDAVNIPDGPRASSRLSAMITAIKLEQTCGIETLLHICCRDRNIIAMQSDLLGIHTIGLQNVLIITGDPPKVGEYPDATGVFDLDSVALTRVVAELNHGLDIAHNRISPQTAFVVGVGANPAASDMNREIERLNRKIEAGAEYIITQPVFDSASLIRFLEASGCRLPVIAGIWPFTSYKNAEFMANEVPGVVVPPSLLERMARAADPTHARRLGIAIAQEMMAEIESSVAGFAVSAPMGNVNMALAAAEKIGIEEI